MERDLAAKPVASPSWPGHARPSALRRRGWMAGTAPGHDGEEEVLGGRSLYLDTYGDTSSHDRGSGTLSCLSPDASGGLTRLQRANSASRPCSSCFGVGGQPRITRSTGTTT